MTQSLAIVGASVRAAAGSARRAGYRPIAADLFADQDLCRRASATRIERYPAGLPNWLRTVRPPAWIYTGALENYPELVDAMAGVAPLLGNGGDVLCRVRSPHGLATSLGEAGLLFPDTRDSADGLPRDGSWLAKTYRGSSGSGVRSHGKAVGCRAGVVFQRRVEGLPCAAVFVAAGGKCALLGVARQLVGEAWLGGGPFQYAGSIAPWPLAEAVRTTIARIGDALASRFALVGLFGVDLVVDDGRVWTIEVNPRYTASIEVVERATGTSAVAAHVAACADGTLNLDSRGRAGARPQSPESGGNACFGKAILFAPRDVVIDERAASWALGEALTEPWPRLADVPASGTHIAAGRPVMTVFAAGRDPGNVEQRLRDRTAEVVRRLHAASN